MLRDWKNVFAIMEVYYITKPYIIMNLCYKDHKSVTIVAGHDKTGLITNDIML